MSHSAPIRPSGAEAAGRLLSRPSGSSSMQRLRPAQPPQPARAEAGRRRPEGLRDAGRPPSKTARTPGFAAGLTRAVSFRMTRFGRATTVEGEAMQVRFSTDDLPPRDRVRFWCDYFAKQARNITPSEIPDPDSFRAEATGSVAGGFALLDIKSGLEKSNAPRPTWPRTRPRRSSSADPAGRRSGGSPQAACRSTSFTSPAISA